MHTITIFEVPYVVTFFQTTAELRFRNANGIGSPIASVEWGNPDKSWYCFESKGKLRSYAEFVGKRMIEVFPDGPPPLLEIVDNKKKEVS